ncbi:MAG: PepSY domain-containing protein [Acidiferrobacterales bacterium]
MKTERTKVLSLRTIVAAALSLVLATAGTAAFAYTGEHLAKDAKIGISQARTIAIKAFPGKVVHEELEHEKGGSGLRYSFDIRRGKTTQEVGVDAKTGKVLENDAEGSNPD